MGLATTTCTSAWVLQDSDGCSHPLPALCLYEHVDADGGSLHLHGCCEIVCWRTVVASLAVGRFQDVRRACHRHQIILLKCCSTEGLLLFGQRRCAHVSLAVRTVSRTICYSLLHFVATWGPLSRSNARVVPMHAHLTARGSAHRLDC